MTACTKKSYRPTLETLEDRFPPSTTPLTLLNPPILNAMAGYVNFVSQQAGAAMTTHAHTLSRQAVQAPAMNVTMYRGDVRPSEGGTMTIGEVYVDCKYLHGDNLKSNLHFEAGYHWGSDKDPSFQFKAPFELRPTGDGFFDIVTDRSFFTGQPIYVALQIRIEIHDGLKMVDGNQGEGGWVVLSNYALNQNQNGGFSATTTLLASANAVNHPAYVAEMSARDQFFVTMRLSNHYNVGSHLLTAADWGA
jgi:hypothetical protein